MTVRTGPTPQQLLTPGSVTGIAGVTRTLHVDGSRADDYVENGSIGQPYKTIQAAVDYAEVSMAPAYNAEVMIMINPKSPYYDEDVIIKKDGIGLIGMGQGWGNITALKRVIITNATAASLATFIGNGGIADPAGNYGDLVQDTYEPWHIYLKDLNIGDLDAPGTNVLMLLGVGAGNDTLSYGLDAFNIQAFGSSYFRLVSYLGFSGDSWLSDVTTYNVSCIWYIGGGVNRFVGDYNSGDDQPVGGNIASLVPDSAYCGSVELSGETKALSRGTMYVAEYVTASETAEVELRGSFVGGDITLSGGAKLYGSDFCVLGDVVLSDTAQVSVGNITRIGGILDMSGSSVFWAGSLGEISGDGGGGVGIVMIDSAEFHAGSVGHVNGSISVSNSAIFGPHSIGRISGAVNVSDSGFFQFPGYVRIDGAVTVSGGTFYCDSVHLEGAVTVSGSATFGASGNVFINGLFTLSDSVSCWLGHTWFNNDLVIGGTANFSVNGGGRTIGTVTVGGSANAWFKEMMRVGNLTGGVGDTDLVVNDTAVVYFLSGHIDTHIWVAGDATLSLFNTYVQGNITLENAGGLVGCRMDGGMYMGGLTDDGARFTRNIGS